VIELKIAALILIMVLVSMMLIPTTSAPSVTSSSVNPDLVSTPQVQVYTALNGSNEYLFLPVNSSGLNAYPDWYVSIFPSESYSIFVNGNKTTTGIGPICLTENFANLSKVTMLIQVGSVSFTFTNETIVGVQPVVNIQGVLVISTFPGQDQQLSILPGQSGKLMYPDWNITMKSGTNVSYGIFIGAQEVYSGHVLGEKSVSLNVSKSPATVTVGLGSKTYTFSNELIATVPLKQYYSPPKAPLVATAFDIIFAVGVGVSVLAIWFVVAGITFRPWIMDRMKRKPRYR
jgi:hypothetical protein